MRGLSAAWPVVCSAGSRCWPRAWPPQRRPRRHARLQRATRYARIRAGLPAARAGTRDCFALLRAPVAALRAAAAGAKPSRWTTGDRLRPGRRAHPGPARQRLRLRPDGRRGRPDGRDRRRLRRPQDRSGPRRIRQTLRAPRMHDRERLLQEGRPERKRGAPCPADDKGVVGRDLARRRGRARGLPELPDPAGRGRQRLRCRPRGGRRTRPWHWARPRSRTPTERLESGLGRSRTGGLRPPRGRDRGRHGRRRLRRLGLVNEPPSAQAKKSRPRPLRSRPSSPSAGRRSNSTRTGRAPPRRSWNSNGPGDESGGPGELAEGATGGGCSGCSRRSRGSATSPASPRPAAAEARLPPMSRRSATRFTGFDIYDTYNCGEACEFKRSKGLGDDRRHLAVDAADHRDVRARRRRRGVRYPALTLYGPAGGPSSRFDVTEGGNGYCDGETSPPCEPEPSSRAGRLRRHDRVQRGARLRRALGRRHAERRWGCSGPGARRR